MTIQTPIAPAAADPVQDQLDALERRSAALMQTHSELHSIFAVALRSASDFEAMIVARIAICGAMLRLDVTDHDLIHRLRVQLHSPDAFQLLEIARDSKTRSHKVDIRIDTIRTRRDAAARRAEAYRVKQQAKKSAYTTAYEAAEKLSPRQRRQLAASIIDN